MNVAGFLGLVALLIGVSLAPVHADKRGCAKLYTNAPRTLGGFSLKEGRDLERRQKGAGYGLNYGNGTKARLTVFFFDDQKRRLDSTDAAERAVVEGFVIARAMEVSGIPEISVSMDTGENFGSGGFFDAEIRAPSGTPRAQVVSVAAINNCYAKIRFSPTGSSLSAFKRIQKDLARYLASR